MPPSAFSVGQCVEVEDDEHAFHPATIHKVEGKDTYEVTYTGRFKGLAETEVSSQRIRPAAAAALLGKRQRKVPARLSKKEFVVSSSFSASPDDDDDEEEQEEGGYEEEEEWQKDHPWVGRRILRQDEREDGGEAWSARGAIVGWLSSERNDGGASGGRHEVLTLEPSFALSAN